MWSSKREWRSGDLNQCYNVGKDNPTQKYIPFQKGFPKLKDFCVEKLKLFHTTDENGSLVSKLWWDIRKKQNSDKISKHLIQEIASAGTNYQLNKRYRWEFLIRNSYLGLFFWTISQNHLIFVNEWEKRDDENLIIFE